MESLSRGSLRPFVFAFSETLLSFEDAHDEDFDSVAVADCKDCLVVLGTVVWLAGECRCRRCSGKVNAWKPTEIDDWIDFPACAPLPCSSESFHLSLTTMVRAQG